MKKKLLILAASSMLLGCAKHTEYLTGPPVPVESTRDEVFSMLMIEGEYVFRGNIYSDDTTEIELIAGAGLDKLNARLWVRYHTTQDTLSVDDGE